MADAWGRPAFFMLAALTAGAGLGSVRRASGCERILGVNVKA